MSSLKSRLFDKWGKPIMANNPLNKQMFGMMPSIYEAPNAGRFRPRYYTEQDTEIGINQYNRSLLLRFSREMVSQQPWIYAGVRSEEHTSELQSLRHLVCRLLLEK